MGDPALLGRFFVLGVLGWILVLREGLADLLVNESQACGDLTRRQGVESDDSHAEQTQHLRHEGVVIYALHRVDLTLESALGRLVNAGVIGDQLNQPVDRVLLEPDFLELEPETPQSYEFGTHFSF